MTELQHTSTENQTTVTSYGKKKKIIHLYIIENSNRYQPINVDDIANGTGLEKSTIRYYIAQLVKENRIFKQKVGMTTTYWSHKTIVQLAQHIKPNPNNPLPLMHGLVMNIDGLSSTDLRLGVKCDCSPSNIFSLNFSKPPKHSRSGFCVCRTCGASLRNNFSYHKEWRDRNITVTYGKVKKSCTIWVGSSFSPMDYYDFKDLINYLEGLVRIDIWENMDKWMVKQIGFNNDVNSRQLDRLDFDCTLNDLGCLFARMYEKDFQVDSHIEKGVRFEVHVETVQRLENFFLPLIQGGMDMSAVLNVNASLHLKLGELIDELKISNKRQRRMEERIITLEKELLKVKKK